MKRGAGDDAGSSKKKKKISIKLKSGKSSSKEKGKKGKAKAEPPADELMQAILDQGGDIAEYERLKVRSALSLALSSLSPPFSLILPGMPMVFNREQTEVLQRQLSCTPSRCHGWPRSPLPGP